MLRSIGFLIGGLAAGWLIAAVWSPGADPMASRTQTPDTGRDLDGRLASLEGELESERRRRLELAAEVDALEAAVARLEEAARPADGVSGRAGQAGGDNVAREGRRDDDETPSGERIRVSREGRAAGAAERRRQRLVDAGFSPDRAEWIARREAELRLAALEARYEARRTGEPVDPDMLEDGGATLRAELGDADYERYLQAMGRPISVGVREVLPGSAAERAGLGVGDRIVGYGGRRVYDVRDLNRLTVDGTLGEPVTLDVVRDGQTIQLVIPRGPLGIAGGGRFGGPGR